MMVASQEPNRGREMRTMGDHVGSGAADCEHDALGGGLGRRRVKALRSLRSASAGQP
jgi:hypothetical protein